MNAEIPSTHRRHRKAMKKLDALVTESANGRLSRSIRRRYPNFSEEAGRIQEARENHTWNGRVCVVTGATGAIGRALAEQFVLLGADVVLAVREPTRAEAVKEELNNIKTKTDQKIAIQQLDLADPNSIKSAVTSFAEQFPTGVDVLVNNSGVTPATYAGEGKGLGNMMQVNYIGPAEFTLEMLRYMKKDGRVVNISSYSDRGDPRHFTDGLPTDGRAKTVYFDSKLALDTFAVTLGKASQTKGVSFDTIHPGDVNKALSGGKAIARLSRTRVGKWAGDHLLLTPRQSALGIIRILETGQRGQPYVFGQQHSLPEAVYDEEFATSLFKATPFTPEAKTVLEDIRRK